MTTPSLIVAIDGHSSTGKSTLAKRLAEAFQLVYVDSGAMYRAMTYHAMQSGLAIDDSFGKDEQALDELLQSAEISFVRDANGANRTFLNGEDVEEQIRTMEVSSKVSVVSAVSAVRKDLVRQQRNLAQNHGVVMDGRDIGTVVFPNADLKIFMTASPEVRAQRRYDELIAKGAKVTLEEVMTNLTSRDEMDSSRADSPLEKAVDAVVLDNSNLTPQEQFDLACTWVKERM